MNRCPWWKIDLIWSEDLEYFAEISRFLTISWPPSISDTIWPCEPHIVSSCWGEVVVVVQYDTLWPCEAHAMWALVEEKRLKHFTPHYWVGDTPWDIRWADRRIFIIISTTAYMPPVVIYVVICGDICATCGDGGGGHQHWWAGRPALRKYFCHQMGAMCDHVTVS